MKGLPRRRPDIRMVHACPSNWSVIQLSKREINYPRYEQEETHGKTLSTYWIINCLYSMNKLLPALCFADLACGRASGRIVIISVPVRLAGGAPSEHGDPQIMQPSRGILD